MNRPVRLQSIISPVLDSIRYPILSALIILVLASPASGQRGGGRAGTITTATLLEEMTDLSALGKMPAPAFRTIQFSSYDRRSVSPDEEGWFSNSDGFGREPIPGFLKVLREPGEDGIGSYLLCEVNGPGAIVRTWSARMAGNLHVYLDGPSAPLYLGDAYTFLAGKSDVFLEEAGLDIDCGDAFRQQDADYLPIPFNRSLTITWEGNLEELHFYHVEVRLYQEGTRVRSFNPGRDLGRGEEDLLLAAAALLTPPSLPAGTLYERSADLAPGTSWDLEASSAGTSGAITLFTLRITAPDMWKALRGTLLQIAFDGAARHQVEAPAGDFFGSGPGVNPFDSLPMSVSEDGTMTCRFVMPFQETALFRFTNRSDEWVHIETSITVSPWEWNDRSLYFRAKWRSDHDLDLASGPLDLPFIVLKGQGRFVGAASFLVNPSAVPTPGGNWWGEGDEKIFVDDDPFPVFFGTGTEDYYNYSWSRPDLFDHPYCGQPLDTGPGTLGYVSNHRWHILDSVPFSDHFAFYLELWHHRAFPGLCYDRIAYCYARPGALDDHRRVQTSELVVRDLPANEPQPLGGASNSTFHHLETMTHSVAGGSLVVEDTQPGASRGHLLCWNAESGDRLTVIFEIEEAGDHAINLVAAHWPESGVLRVSLDGVPLTVTNLGGAGMGERGQTTLVLRSGFARRLLSTGFERGTLEAGEHELVLECVEPGRFGFDYFWIRKY